ncbi:hypothetical protein ABPG74_005482 [Tetrahymena malaccensis]
MQFVEELNSFKEKCQDVLYNVKNIKKVDKDIIAQMNQSICMFGDQINQLMNDNHILSEQYKDEIDDVIQIYEQATQNLDDIIYKHKGIQSQLMSDIKIQNNKDLNEAPNNKLKQDISQFTYFRLFEKLNMLENNSIEFKNYTINSFNNRDIKNICKKTIVSFLNRNGGCIYVGIRDDSMVVGMKLDYSQMDSLKRKIITIKAGISPQMNEKVKVDFVPIKQGQRWYKGHWIVRIMVKQGDLNTLYYFNNQNDNYSLESYFREDGAVIRYKIHDFIQEQIDIALQKNPKSRIICKKEYAEADQEGLEASIIWSSQEQNSYQKYNQNSSESYSSYHNEPSSENKILKNAKMDEDHNYNIPKHKLKSNPFDGISINEKDINQMNNFKYQEEIQKLQQDAAQRKNELISKRDNHLIQPFQFNQQQQKYCQQIDQNKKFIQNMNTKNADEEEEEKANQHINFKNQGYDQKQKHQFNSLQEQNQKQINFNNQNQQNLFYENLQNNHNIQQVQNQSNQIPPQNVAPLNNQNQKKKPKKFGAMFYQALCGQQQQN